MVIVNSQQEDLSRIFELYKEATDLQRILCPYNVWPVFDPKLIIHEIEEKRQWKLLIDGQIVCIWATTFSDPMIWEERNADPAVYIHRIATYSKFKGQKFVQQIVSWAKKHAQQNGKKFIRLDTCGNNQKLIAHYTSCGFDFLGISKLKSAEGLPSHYHDADVCFFELEL